MAEWPDGCIDSIVTDPPYGLRFMGKRWDYSVPSVELWAECYRVLKDGGRLLAFSGARTQHRMVCNIEDAGFCIEDCMMWLYGSGFPKHGSKLKPAYEPICVARKGSVSLLNIDAGRIGTDERTNRGMSSLGVMHDDNWQPRDVECTVNGRWPANVLLDEAAAAELDRQSGDIKAAWPGRPDLAVGYAGTPVKAQDVCGFGVNRAGMGYSDSGGASRYFFCAKADSAERNAGCGGLEMRVAGGLQGRQDGTLGSQTIAANTHPTVKPVALMQYLLRLFVPAGGLVLDPFLGSGTTGVAAERDGVRWCGIELNPEYCEIARARTAQKGLFTCQT